MISYMRSECNLMILVLSLPANCRGTIQRPRFTGPVGQKQSAYATIIILAQLATCVMRCWTHKIPFHAGLANGHEQVSFSLRSNVY